MDSFLDTFNDGDLKSLIRSELNLNAQKLMSRGMYSCTVSQKPTTTTPEPIIFDTQDQLTDGIAADAGTGEFTVNYAYRYLFTTRLEVERTIAGGGREDILIFAQRKPVGGVFEDIPRSTVAYEIGGNVSTALFHNLVYEGIPGDTIRLMLQVTDSSKGMGLHAEPAGSGHPAVPSAVMTTA